VKLIAIIAIATTANDLNNDFFIIIFFKVLNSIRSYTIRTTPFFNSGAATVVA
jgi:hypothetical protein